MTKVAYVSLRCSDQLCAKCHVDSSCYSVILRRERTSKTSFLLFLIFVWTTFNFQLHKVLMPNNSTRPTPLKLSLMATRFTQVQRKVSRLVHVDIRYTLRRCPLDRFELRSFTHLNQAICINKLYIISLDFNIRIDTDIAFLKIYLDIV